MAQTNDALSPNVPEEIAQGSERFVGREWLIRRIDDWLARTDASAALLLTAPAGWGKSVLAARLATSNPAILYAHFCRARDDRTLDPRRFVEGLSSALAAAAPSYGAALAKALEERVGISGNVKVESVASGGEVTGIKIDHLTIADSGRAVFDQIIRRPLEQAMENGEGLGMGVVLVDGVDEALTYRAGETILDVLRAGWGDGASPPPGLRLIVTSRPTPEVTRALPADAISLDDASAENASDLRTYVEERLAEVTGATPDLVAEISEASAGSFLYARMVVDEIASGRASPEDLKGAPRGLSDYLRASLSELTETPERWEEQFRPVLGAIAIAGPRGLDATELSRVTGLPRSRVDQALRQLARYLHADSEGRYRLFHPALGHFLFTDSEFFVYPDELRDSFRRFPALAPLVADSLALPEEPPGVGTLAGYVSDAVPRGAALRDRLGIQTDVNALCSVMVASDVHPPLSVGLFGDWGTGKSFFMQLMQRRIRAIADRVRDQPGAETAFCSNVKQIEFNAWHYADANLWASLVIHIFERLVEDDAERTKLISSLETTAFQRQEAERRLQAAEVQRRRAEDRFKQIEAIRQPNGHPIRKRWQAVAEHLPDEELADAAERMTRELGRSVDVPSIAEEARVLRRLWGKLRELWGLMRGLARLRFILATAVAVLLMALAVALAAATGAWQAILALVGSAVVAVAEFARDVRGPLTRVRRAATIATDAAEQIELGLQKAVTDARQQLDAAREEYARAERALEDLTGSGALYKFVEERLASDDYRRHLGLVAHIRRDFENLVDLLQAQNGDGGATTEGGTPLPRIDRVILYVDDLDRCPANRVVEVLEAVHLLLAFELFVVVVGVDSRWLLTSLAHHYRTHLSAPDSGAENVRAAWSTTPQNYLEKIFQIPYALRPMQSEGFERLVRSMVPVETEDGLVESEAAPPNRERANGERVTERESRGREASPPASRGARSVGEVADDVGAGGDDLASVPIELKPPGLSLNEAEVGFMSMLWRLVRTPRAAKRLVNTYRLLRAPLGPAGLARLTGGDGRLGDYPAVLMLLAAMIGYPALSSRFFAEVMGQPAELGWWEWLARHAASGGAAENEPKTDESSGRPVLPERDEARYEWATLAGELLRLRPHAEIEGSFSAFQAWAPRVARFSFEPAALVPEVAPIEPVAHKPAETRTGVEQQARVE